MNPHGKSGSTDPQDLHKKLIFLPEKVGYAMGDVGSVLYYAIWITFLLNFYTDVFGLSPAVAGWVLLGTRVWDAVNDPLMGMVTDRTKSRHGKFRPWLRWMIVPYVVVGVITFITPDFSEWGKVLYAVITYTLLGMIYTAINIPYSAMLGVITPHSGERTILAQYRFLGAFSAKFIVDFSMLSLVGFFGGLFVTEGAGEQAIARIGYPVTVLFYGILAAGAFLAAFHLTKERIKPPENQKPDIKKDLAELLKNPPWLTLVAIVIITLIWINVRNASIVYYYEHFVGDKTAAGIFLSLGTLGTLLGVLLTKVVTNLFGSKKATFLWLNLFSVILNALSWFAGPEDTLLRYTAQILVSFCMGPMLTLIWSMLADTADYAEYKFRRRSTGLIFSAGTFAMKMGGALGQVIVAWTLDFVDYDVKIGTTPEVQDGVRFALSHLPAAGALIASGMVLFYGLSKSKNREIEDELIRRRQEEEDTGPPEPSP